MNSSNIFTKFLVVFMVLCGQQMAAAANKVVHKIYGKTVVLYQGNIVGISGVDALVNAANERVCSPTDGGVAGAIRDAAGRQLLNYVQTNNLRCLPGAAVITPSFDLARLGVKHIIHTVAPRGNSQNRAQILRNCYLTTLQSARHAGCTSIAIPALGTGIYGYPQAEAANIAVATTMEMLRQPTSLNTVVFVFSKDQAGQQNFALYQQNLARFMPQKQPAPKPAPKKAAVKVAAPARVRARVAVHARKLVHARKKQAHRVVARPQRRVARIVVRRVQPQRRVVAKVAFKRVAPRARIVFARAPRRVVQPRHIVRKPARLSVHARIAFGRRR